MVIGGTSAELALETAKLASARYLDTLPTSGNELGRGFRDVELEAEVLALSQAFGIGAQFGGKYFCHDVRVIRLPRHGASLPVAVAVSCSADRQALGKITADGVFLEQLEHDPAHYLPDVTDDRPVRRRGAHRPQPPHGRDPGRAEPVPREDPPGRSRARWSWPATSPTPSSRSASTPATACPQYLKDHPVYYAGPAKTPEGYASGSFGPTTAGRMDSYVDLFQANGGLDRDAGQGQPLPAGHRRLQARTAASTSGSIGGPAARLAQDCIRSVEVLEYPELGMEAVWKIEVEDFPAFVVVDDKGNDFFQTVSRPVDLKV